MTVDVEAIAKTLRDQVVKVVSPLAARLKALEARPTMSWRGPWSPAETYAAGDVTQRAKGLYVCLVSTTGDDKPGESDRWRRLAFTD